MPNSLYRQLNGSRCNPTIERLKQFKKTFTGDPQLMVQQMLNSGKLSQGQLNQYAQQANHIYEQMKDLL